MKLWKRKQGHQPEATRKAVLRCSFCNRAADDVPRLIAGPHVYICSACVEICNEIIADAAILDSERRPSPNVVERPQPGFPQPILCGLCRDPVPLDQALAVRDRGWLCQTCMLAVREAF